MSESRKLSPDNSLLHSATDAELPSAIDDLVHNWSDNTLPPVHQWQPSVAREIDMRIAKDGQWFYQGTPINRPRLIQLFSRVMRMESDGSTWLVTPHEKLKIQVDDAHFQAVLLDVEERHQLPALVFSTNVGERITADAEHPIEVRYLEQGGEPAPYLHLRHGLIARISRSVFMQLANRAEVRENVAGVTSCGEFMPLGPAE